MYSRIALLYVKLKERSALEAGRMRHQRVTKQFFFTHPSQRFGAQKIINFCTKRGRVRPKQNKKINIGKIRIFNFAEYAENSQYVQKK